MEDLVKDYRKELENEKGSLDGWCHYCAIKLCERLSEEGYNPVVVWGSLDNSPENIEELEKQNGSTHIWVSLEGTSKCLDLYSNTKNRGEVIVEDNSPKEYYEYARIKYESWMRDKHFINYEGYKELKERADIKEVY
jgi:hypothetical protein